MNRHNKLFFFWFFLFILANTAHGRELPKLTGRVVDEAGMLTAEQEALLTQKLADYEKQTTNQIVVVTIPSLEGEVLEDFSIRLAEKWKIGQKGKDNGVILLVSKQDRKIRIEVGYGLEGVLTDSISGDIIRNTIAPRLKEGEFYQGMDAAVNLMFQTIAGEFKRIERKNRWENFRKPFNQIPANAPFILIILASCFIAALLRDSRVKGFLALFGVFLISVVLNILITGVCAWGDISVLLVVWLFMVLICVSDWNKGSGGSSWSSSSSSSYSSGGGESSSSSFSGGGGSFGGGGASGGW